MRYSFDSFEVDPALFELRSAGTRVPMEPQAFDVLLYLLRHRDHVVGKQELMDEIWGGRFVSETAVTSRIKQVRRALGDDGDAQRLIRTQHGRGYRFVGEVTEHPGRAVRRRPEHRRPPPGLRCSRRRTSRRSATPAATDSTSPIRSPVWPGRTSSWCPGSCPTWSRTGATRGTTTSCTGWAGSVG